MNKLYINLTRIGKNGSGLFRYSERFIDCISAIIKESDLYVIHSSQAEINKDKIKNINVPGIISNTPGISLLRPILWYFYSYWFFPKLDGKVITTTHHVVPGIKRQIITIHDLRPYFYPDSVLQKVYFRYILPYKVKQIDGIITVSNATKELIANYYKINPNKIFVVPNVVDIKSFKQEKKNRNIEVPYLLMIGSTWKHKNAHEVIEMFETWAHKYSLKIVAKKGAYAEHLKKMVAKRKLNDKVQFIEHYITELELIELYQDASALIYPSLMEGFGIPLIEAMACGIPVIASDIEVFREVCGDIPIYIKHGDKQSWHEAIESLDDKVLISSKIQAGLKKSSYYNEERMKNGIIEVIKKTWSDTKLN